MDIVEIVLSSALGMTLVVVVWLYQRMRQNDQAAQTRQAQLEANLATLTQQAAQVRANLEEQVQTLTEKLQTSQRHNAELDIQIDALKQQCLRLRDQIDSQSQQVTTDTQLQAFEQVQTLLTQYPSVQKIIEVRPDLPARNLVALLGGLDNLIRFWGYQPIGNVWEAVPYDPQIHQGDVDDLKAEEPVYIRFVGYRQGDKILIPAKVSRTLPAGAHS